MEKKKVTKSTLRKGRLEKLTFELTAGEPKKESP